MEGLAAENFARAVFAAGAPYGRPTGGTAATLRSLTRADVVAWHRARYAPATTTLLLVGDVGADEARRLATEAFGAWRGTARRGPSPASALRPVTGTRVILMDRPGSVQSAIRVGQGAVGAEDPDFFRMTALTQVLGGGFNARVNQNLRERHGWTYGAFASLSALAGTGTMVVSSSVRTSATDSALAESVRELRRLARETVPGEEMQGALGNLVGSFPASVQTVQGLAQRMQTAIVYGLPLDYYATYRERLAAVTPAEAAELAGAAHRPRRAHHRGGRRPGRHRGAHPRAQPGRGGGVEPGRRADPLKRFGPLFWACPSAVARVGLRAA